MFTVKSSFAEFRQSDYELEENIVLHLIHYIVYDTITFNTSYVRIVRTAAYIITYPRPPGRRTP